MTNTWPGVSIQHFGMQVAAAAGTTISETKLLSTILLRMNLACHFCRQAGTGTAAAIPPNSILLPSLRSQNGTEGRRTESKGQDRGNAAAAAENNNVQNTKLVRVINKMESKRGLPAARRARLQHAPPTAD